MTDVANYDHGRAPLQRHSSPSAAKADKVRKTIARIRSQFLAPFDAWETYLEALIEALDHTGLPPAAVAKTCNEVYSTSTFAPTVAEVLTKAKETHASLSFAVRQIDQYAELMAWAKKVRDWIATVPLLKEDRANADRAPRPPASLTFHRSTAEWR